MKTRAAILWEQNADWSVEEIDLDPPKAGEVLVKLVGSGLCHSDEHLRTGDMVVDQDTADLLGLEQFPVIGGHEGAGEVLEVGPGVTSVAPGDHVVLGFIPSDRMYVEEGGARRPRRPTRDTPTSRPRCAGPFARSPPCSGWPKDSTAATARSLPLTTVSSRVRILIFRCKTLKLFQNIAKCGGCAS